MPATSPSTRATSARAARGRPPRSGQPLAHRRVVRPGIRRSIRLPMSRSSAHIASMAGTSSSGGFSDHGQRTRHGPSIGSRDARAVRPGSSNPTRLPRTAGAGPYAPRTPVARDDQRRKIGSRAISDIPPRRIRPWTRRGRPTRCLLVQPRSGALCSRPPVSRPARPRPGGALVRTTSRLLPCGPALRPRRRARHGGRRRAGRGRVHLRLHVPAQEGRPGRLRGRQGRRSRANGGFSGSATSDKTGRWTITVPRPGQLHGDHRHQVAAQGRQPHRPGKESLKVPVLFGQQKPVLFPLGKSTRVVESKWSQAVQLTAEGLRFGLIIALAAVGPVADLRHDRADQLRPRRAGDLRRARWRSGSAPATCRCCRTSAGCSSSWRPSIALVLCGVFGWLNDAGSGDRCAAAAPA